MRLVQLAHDNLGRKVALVDEPNLILLDHFSSVFEMVQFALQQKSALRDLIRHYLSEVVIDYDTVYTGGSNWKLLSPVDHPELNACYLTGTGLTHRSSAMNRNAMHENLSPDQMTDSMKMYLMGVEGGTPSRGKIGIQPEWFYKGNGSIMKAHGTSLSIPSYARDGGEEPEVAGVYYVDNAGIPWRIGFVAANEFSDHIMERQNYLYLAPSKIRECAVGPELVLDLDFSDINGKVSVIRRDETVWTSEIKTGEKNMCHSLPNLEYHHFKYANHRVPQQIHIHFFGADAFSFGAGIKLQENDVMEVSWENLGRPLRNSIQIDQLPEKMFQINNL